MIPKLLKFQGFASYKNQQIIDFEKLSSNDIFLIHGKTGSGKTSILDAITYVLYGKSSGGGRGEFEEMRCRNHGATSQPTEIEFVFEVRGKTYKFIRRAFERTKRTGKIEIECEYNALYLENDNFIPFYENPKKQLINDKAVELIGLDYNQFMQVVILPQGKFENFLVAPSKTKEEILVTLFQIENWNAIGDWLCSQANKMEAENKLKIATQKSILEQLECESKLQLNDKISELSTFEAELILSLGDINKKIKAIQKNLEQELNTQKLFSQKQALEQTLLVLNSRAYEIKGYMAKIARNQNAQKVQPYYDIFTSSNNINKQREIEFNNSKITLDTSINKSNGTKLLLTELEAKSEQNSKSREQLVLWTSLEKHYSNHNEAKKLFENTEREANLLKQKLEITLKSELQLSDNKVLLYNEREEIHQVFQKQFNDLQLEKTNLNQAKKLADEIDKGELLLKQYLAELALKNNEIAVCENAIKTAKSEQKEKYDLHISYIANDLSKSLIEGEACPVCGSCHHPEPVSMKLNDGIDYSKELKLIATQIADYETQYSKLVVEKLSLDSRIENGNNYINERKTQASLLPKFNEADYVKICKEFEIAQEKINSLTSLNAKISANDVNLDKIFAEKKQLEIALLKATQENSESKARLKIIEEQLAPSISDLATLQHNIITQKRLVESFDNDLLKLKELSQALQESLSADKARFEQAKLEFSKSNEIQKDSILRLESALSENNFLNIDEFLNTRLTEEMLTLINEKCNSYTLEKSVAEESLAKLIIELADKQAPNVEAIRKELFELEKSRDTVSNGIALCKEKYIRFEKTLSDYILNEAELEIVIFERKRLWAFGAELRGDRGIGLRRYVLGVMLESVIMEANRLLKGVKGGQFKLHNIPAEKGSTGLDLLIESNKTDSKYSVAALSGGEKFLVAISLSIALSTVVQMQAGGVAIDAMFIDEGFGSLDPTALDEAMEVLQGMTGSRKFLGIISHVEALKETIHSKLEVTNDTDGSHIKISI